MNFMEWMRNQPTSTYLAACGYPGETMPANLNLLGVISELHYLHPTENQNSLYSSAVAYYASNPPAADNDWDKSGPGNSGRPVFVQGTRNQSATAEAYDSLFYAVSPMAWTFSGEPDIDQIISRTESAIASIPGYIPNMRVFTFQYEQNKYDRGDIFDYLWVKSSTTHWEDWWGRYDDDVPEELKSVNTPVDVETQSDSEAFSFYLNGVGNGQAFSPQLWSDIVGHANWSTVSSRLVDDDISGMKSWDHETDLRTWWWNETAARIALESWQNAWGQHVVGDTSNWMQAYKAPHFLPHFPASVAWYSPVGCGGHFGTMQNVRCYGIDGSIFNPITKQKLQYTGDDLDDSWRLLTQDVRRMQSAVMCSKVPLSVYINDLTHSRLGEAYYAALFRAAWFLGAHVYLWQSSPPGQSPAESLADRVRVDAIATDFKDRFGPTIPTAIDFDVASFNRDDFTIRSDFGASVREMTFYRDGSTSDTYIPKLFVRGDYDQVIYRTTKEPRNLYDVTDFLAEFDE